ncbi:MAG: ABC-F family ATP-binding cassette domain-containing protein [Planctomycetes bacterium]|nr:ABC-F family ATP-binding cassette domain-containing protein [Planctomycetota bacterium]
MAAISLKNVCRQFGLQIVLRDVSLELQSNQITGLVGDNGSGKTTLIKLINRDLPPDTGTITCERGLKIGLLTQEPDVSLERTLHDEVASVFEGLLAIEATMHALSEEMAALHDDPKLPELMEKYERVNAEFITAGGHTFEARLHEILGGLGFSPADYDKPVSILSGGQKCRAALAKLLLADRAYLLLDEPTNHLDIDATRWLEKFLASHKGGALIISHDRYLLDRVCDRIVEIEQTRVTAYPGNYTNYVKTRDVRLLTQERQFEKDTEFIQKERAFIAKHIAGQRTKEAQGRRSRLERRLAAGEFVTELPNKTRTARITFREVAEQVGVVVRGEELTMSYGDNTLFTDLNFMAHAGRRFGITGPNGCGKTTLLKIILGEVEPKTGKIERDEKLRIGYYGQEHIELEPERSVLDEIRTNCKGMSKQEARDLLARFLFRGDDVFKPLGKLSGGEQSRVRLLKLMLESPDMLILDEPTNHLDIRSCEALEEALKGFPGTIVAVSHDRYFLDRLIDRLLVMRPGGCVVYEGNYSYYLEQIEQESLRGKPGASRGRKKARQEAKHAKRPKTASSPFDRLSVEELEEIVMKHETELAELHERFGEPAVYLDPDLLTELREQAEQVERDLAAVDAAWQQRVDSQ